MYDRSKRSGLLYEKVRYKNRKRAPKKPTGLITPNASVAQAVVPGNDNHDIDELISFFDSCVLSRDKKSVLEKMKSSADIRMQSNQNSRDFFDKCFHLYRIDMDLVNIFFMQENMNVQGIRTFFYKQVLEDYKFMYPMKDHEALLTKWTQIENKPFALHQIVLDRQVENYHRDDTVHKYVDICQTVPNTPI